METKLIEIENISGENALPVSQLPAAWQAIAQDDEQYKMSDRQAYVKMAQLFMYKFSQGDLDLFNQDNQFSEHKDAFTKIFGKLAEQTLTFYGEDFKVDNYPNFESIRSKIDTNDVEYAEKIKVIEIAEELFAEFGYDLPASFYFVHLAPLGRSALYEVVPLRFSEEDKKNARAWDASLHGQKVFPMQLVSQSISSKKGFVWEHGCGCNHALARIGRTDSSFTYELRPEMRTTWIRDFVWTVWYEYAFFNFTPVTKFLVE